MFQTISIFVFFGMLIIAALVVLYNEIKEEKEIKEELKDK